tara:strand:+ start:1749 stop:2420 length:672 start_codon:yes stop_codon:yes gene_type:complete
MTPLYHGGNRHDKRLVIKYNLKLAKAVARFLKFHSEVKQELEKFQHTHVSYCSIHSKCPAGYSTGTNLAHCHPPWTEHDPNANNRSPVSRICIQQKFLAAPFQMSTLGQSRFGAGEPLKVVDRVLGKRIPIILQNPLLKKLQRYYWKEGIPYSGVWAIIDLMCHEVAHTMESSYDYSTKKIDSHGSKFYKNYLKLQKIMVTAVKTRDSSLPLELCTALWGHHD